MDRTKTILCPVDFSPASLRAARKAAILGRAMGARLLLLHVIDLVVPAGLGLVGLSPSQVLTEHERKVRGELQALAGQLAEQQGVQVDVWLTAGAVYEIIVRAANERDAILIVMGRGKQGPLRMLGSVADRVVRKAPCPTIVCPKVAEAAHLDAAS